MRPWSVWLTVALFGSVGHAQRLDPIEVQAKRYLHTCITEAASHVIDRGALRDGLSCADLDLPPPQAVLHTRISVTGTGTEDFYVSVTDRENHQYQGDVQHYPALPPRPSSPEQLARARADALKVGAQNLSRQCDQLRSTFAPNISQFPGPFQHASCADLGFDPEALQWEATAGINVEIQKTIRQCQIALAQAREQLSPAAFNALNGQSCLNETLPLSPLTRQLGLPADLRSTFIELTGPSPDDVRITVTDRQGRIFQGGGQTGFPALSTAQRRYLAMKNDAAPVFYACLLRLEQLRTQLDLPDARNGKTCADIHVETYGLHTEIHLFPWTPEHYRLTVITPSGQRRSWPERPLPTEQQAKSAQRAHELAVQGRSIAVNAVIALFAFSLLVRLPRVRFLDAVFGAAGLLALILTVPTLWQPPEFGDAIGLGFAYVLIAGFALFGISLWLPYAAYRQRSLLPSFGMAFVAGALMVITMVPLLFGVTMGTDIRFIWWSYPVIGLGQAAYWKFLKAVPKSSRTK